MPITIPAPVLSVESEEVRAVLAATPAVVAFEVRGCSLAVLSRSLLAGWRLSVYRPADDVDAAAWGVEPGSLREVELAFWDDDPAWADMELETLAARCVREGWRDAWAAVEAVWTWN